jgi:hypothetical protein
LQKEKQAHLVSIESLEKQLQEVKRLAQARETKLLEEGERQKASMNSIYEDLSSSRDEVHQLQAELDSLKTEDGNARGEEAIIVSYEASKQEGEKIKVDLRRQLKRQGSQADFLNSVGNKSKKEESTMGFFGKNKTRALEEENARLKSSLVRLQTQYKEENYKNMKIIRELKQGSDDDEDYLTFLKPLSEDSRPSLRRAQSFQPGATRPSLRRAQSIQQGEETIVSSLIRSDSLRRIKEYKSRRSTREEQKESSFKEYNSVSDDLSPRSTACSIFSEDHATPRRTKILAFADRYGGWIDEINLHDYATQNQASRPTLLDRSPSLRRLTAGLPSWR